jgi:hypothetical protein
VFGGWSSRSRDVGGRPSGLGGAYVAVADDGRSAVINPAGIALVPDVEAALGFGELWASLATSLRGETVPISGQPANAGQPRPCPPGPQPRPWVLAFFGQQTLTRESRVEVVAGPGRLENGVLAADREQVGVSVARGLTHWLNLGLTVTWRHLRMDAATSLRSADGAELSRVVVEGDANKARALVGTLATFGPARSPTQFRVGVAYERDLSAWNVGRREIDVAAGTAAAPATVRIEEPPLFSGGAAWRINDGWLVTGQLDYIWYEDVLSTLHTNQVPEAGAFAIQDGFEPRFAIEHTRPSPIGGYLKVRAGVRRETSGRLHYTGTDLARAQAFPDVGPAFRGSAGVSLLAEFYARAARIDLDLSQVVVARTSSLSAAGTRRFSFNITVRL